MLRLALVAMLVAGPALAQQGDPPKRIRSVEIKKGEACPKASGDEVVVCRTIEEPYRIPSELRDEGAAAQPNNQSWVNRAADVDRTSRVAGGLPNTCSVVGNGGQTGLLPTPMRAAMGGGAQGRAGGGATGGRAGVSIY